MAIKTCPDCKGELEQGTILDYTHSSILGERYAKVDKIPVGKKMFMWLTETDYKDIRRVISYRCVDCNRLFPYAQDEIISTSGVSNLSKNFLTVFLISLIAITFILIISGFTADLSNF